MISVIVPVYNMEKYLARCIESLLDQTYVYFELILIDDGSTDDSYNILSYYAQRDPRIRVLSQVNGGIGVARNLGISSARGEHLAFIDSDDWVHPRYLEILFKGYEQYNLDIIQCGFTRFSEDMGPRIDKSAFVEIDFHALSPDMALKRLYDKKHYLNSVISCNKLFARHIFDDVQFPQGVLYEDEAVIHELLYRANGLVVVDLPLYGYYIRPGSITNRGYSLKNLDALNAFERRLAFFHQNRELALYEMTFTPYFRLLLKLVHAISCGEFEVGKAMDTQLRIKLKAIAKKCAWSRFSFGDILTWTMAIAYLTHPSLGFTLLDVVNHLRGVRNGSPV